MSRGTDNSLLVGAAGGLLSGAVVGGLLGYAFGGDREVSGARIRSMLAWGAALGSTGLLGGAAIGALVSNERWQRLTIVPQVSHDMGEPEWGLRVTWRF
ncbi:MAG: hypothetical protein HOP28_07495 [Gemmatimonadales bacterium]|nr:hypothetical protein [Gemmatimonadales bacterium]